MPKNQKIGPKVRLNLVKSAIIRRSRQKRPVWQFLLISKAVLLSAEMADISITFLPSVGIFCDIWAN